MAARAAGSGSSSSPIWRCGSSRPVWLRCSISTCACTSTPSMSSSGTRSSWPDLRGRPRGFLTLGGAFGSITLRGRPTGRLILGSAGRSAEWSLRGLPALCPGLFCVQEVSISGQCIGLVDGKAHLGPERATALLGPSTGRDALRKLLGAVELLLLLAFAWAPRTTLLAVGAQHGRRLALTGLPRLAVDARQLLWSATASLRAVGGCRRGAGVGVWLGRLSERGRGGGRCWALQSGVDGSLGGKNGELVRGVLVPRREVERVHRGVLRERERSKGGCSVSGTRERAGQAGLRWSVPSCAVSRVKCTRSRM